ncbi:SAM-dependent methyltransferase [Actinophytocola sp.]|uniref:SAM-dependent methyltransferase n=1 Tax=Actinophytocola sp. TaxID=1872138 RepID=UPI002D810D7E|nr:SAM-dependent methyltransferase [Actinophytocola sp.]HET9138861.1 SAM-dependent methyltransferase [Actinophytocola sp.]
MTSPRPPGPDWVNLDRPSPARVYDYLLGGGHNFPVDREAANHMLRVLPGLDAVAGWNRAFLRRAVLFMIDQGITQFLDLGSGIPTVGNVHEIAQRADPGCRVVYVDRDEVAVAHTEMVVADDENTAILRADIRTPHVVLRSPQVGRLLDLRRPVGLLMVAVMHFVSDEADPGGVIAAYLDALPPGSVLALSHLTADHRPTEVALATKALSNTCDQVHPRSYDQVSALFTGLELVDPGVVGVPFWRPELTTGADGVGHDDMYAGVARKV